MTRRLPSLNALRAFEAAGRHLSFTKAAEELNVTQAAVSHQVKALETQLGLQLFRRLNRRLLLTDTGQAYLPSLTAAFDQIADTTDRLANAPARESLRVSVLPSTAAKWLLPRLTRFNARHPDIDVLVSSNHALVDFRRDDVDLAVRFGQGHYPGLVTVPLMQEQVFPVCSPKLLTDGPPLREPRDLAHHTLLHSEHFEGDIEQWSVWLEAVGVSDIDASRGPFFSDSNLVLDAAAGGQGVALGRRSLAANDLAAGRLVIPFGPVKTSEFSHWVVFPRTKADLPKVSNFLAWLLEEAEADEGAGELVAALPPT